MMTTTKTIMVTGGAGFLGRHLCKKLLAEEGPQVRILCIDNLVTGSLENIAEFANDPRFHFLPMDISSLADDECHCNENGFLCSKDIQEYICNEGKNEIRLCSENIRNCLANTDIRLCCEDFRLCSEPIHEIYHLACIASPDKYKVYSIETLTTCFVGTKTVLDIARKHGAKILFSSTSEVYGDPTVHPQPEEYYGNVNTVGERSCYDEGKRVAETLMYEYRKKYNLDTKIVRIFNTFGPYMDINDGRVITNFIQQVFSETPTFKIYGDGSQTRSFCYVDDLIDGIYRMMQSSECGPINIGNPNCEFSLNQLIEIFNDLCDSPITVEYIAATENDPRQRKPVITKACEKLGFSPVVGIEEGIRKTILFFAKDRTGTTEKKNSDKT